MTAVGRFSRRQESTAGVDWRAAFADLEAAWQLPTAALARQRFWLDGLGAVGGDLRCRLAGVEHGLLAAGNGPTPLVVLTGRISVVAAVAGRSCGGPGAVLFPGTGFIESALRAGDEVRLLGAAGS